MSNRILIVDDDDDFRSLLSDLYTQADYQVKSVSNPVDALKILAQENFSLCVTDQSMPELKGVDFIEQSREIKPNLPIIMVSAYLSDDLTQRLKTMRIEVFHKPLNIMSLLRKTSELIKMASTPIENKIKPKEAFKEEAKPKEKKTKIESNFKSFSLKSDASKRLKKEIESIGSSMPNLVFVGDEGTHFRSMCEDTERIVNKAEHHFIYLTNRKLNVFDISKRVTGQPATKTLVFALTEAYCLGVAHKQALLKLYKKTGPFSGVTNPVKFIFCLHEDLDTQFVKGAIDEDFYLILGQKEIYIPRLNLCKEDIPDLADQIAKELVASGAVNTTFGGFEEDTQELFCSTEWKQNHESLRNTVASSLKLAGGKKINRTTLTQAIDNPSSIEEIEPKKVKKVTQTVPLQESKVVHPQSDTQIVKPTASIPTAKLGAKSPKIQSFPMLDDESELAKSIFSKLM